VNELIAAHKQNFIRNSLDKIIAKFEKDDGSNPHSDSTGGIGALLGKAGAAVSGGGSFIALRSGPLHRPAKVDCA